MEGQFSSHPSCFYHTEAVTPFQHVFKSENLLPGPEERQQKICHPGVTRSAGNVKLTLSSSYNQD